MFEDRDGPDVNVFVCTRQDVVVKTSHETLPPRSSDWKILQLGLTTSTYLYSWVNTCRYFVLRRHAPVLAGKIPTDLGSVGTFIAGQKGQRIRWTDTKTRRYLPSGTGISSFFSLFQGPVPVEKNTHGSIPTDTNTRI